ncbi:MAG TPA: hypothetical protein VMG99_08940 [Thermoplasmata archaeon]|nr:hypothetical protein [Thermoplasmata archaeon]
MVICSVPTCALEGTRWAHVAFRVQGPGMLPRVPSPFTAASPPVTFSLTVPEWVCDWHARGFQEQGYLVQPPLPPKGSTADVDPLARR